jgi:hypothetical protein
MGAKPMTGSCSIVPDVDIFSSGFVGLTSDGVGVFTRVEDLNGVYKRCVRKDEGKLRKRNVL